MISECNDWVTCNPGMSCFVLFARSRTHPTTARHIISDVTSPHLPEGSSRVSSNSVAAPLLVGQSAQSLLSPPRLQVHGT